jgi:hypothetical protein
MEPASFSFSTVAVLKIEQTSTQALLFPQDIGTKKANYYERFTCTIWFR